MSKSYICQDNSNSLCIIWHNDELLLKSGTNPISLPRIDELQSLNLEFTQKVNLGLYENTAYLSFNLGKRPNTLPFNLFFQPLRQTHETLNNSSLFNFICRAKQLINWDKVSQFCGRCGQKNRFADDEFAKICMGCQAQAFPQISPAMLVLIWRSNEILLARSAHFLPGIYSILAGFAEPGETIETTVIREVKEEVGLRIKNLHYFGSQAWPFPSNLMLGFRAEYDEGEIQIDYNELEDAQWFPLAKLPQLPKPLSLSRQIIDHHLALTLT
ncbi:MAG: NAD(+) diphosphatase [Tatlockia sp.]|nr:NAD(+) diphosphatase [Tatlockia sp.]